jgi:hypothetical protein
MRMGVPETVPAHGGPQAVPHEPSWSTGGLGAHEAFAAPERSAATTPERAMEDRQRTLMKRLLDRLLATRARRDREQRDTASWRAADTELHEIERAIFRVPLEEQMPAAYAVARPRHVSTALRRHLRRATLARPRGIEGHGAG